MAQLYQKLEDGHFRLLSFDNSTGTACQLKSYQIDRAPPYIALSYTWGAANIQHEAPRQITCRISVNGEQVEVRQNLYDALRNLAVPIQHQQCLLWVDALCINQTDVEERNAEVRKMKIIFEKADRVFAWLGLPHDRDETRLAVKLMRMLYLYLHAATKDTDLDVFIDNLRMGLAWLSGGDIENRKAWLGISNIFNRPYWGRTWIYQEVTTPADIQFWCGQYSFDSESFSAAVVFSVAFLMMPGFDNRSMEQKGNELNVARALEGRLDRITAKHRRLIDLLYRIRQTSCTDPKDKVYSLIGHATDVAPDQLSIDYNKSLTDVYVDVVRLHVFHKENPTIDILGHVLTLPDDITQQERANSPMPSWVPDWRQRAVKSPIHEDPVSSDVASYPYDPCPGTTIEAYIMDGTLELRGIVMENLRIETLTGSWYNDDASENLLTPRRWYDDFLSNGDASLDEPVRRALVGNRTTTVPGKQAVGRTQDDRMVDWDLVGMENAQLDRLGYRKKRMMIRDVTHVCFRRRMAMLTDRSIAIVPIGSQTGDQITLFHGGKALYVLRSIPERQDTFRFIGECYVEGLMDGALAELNTQSGRTAGLVRMI